MSEAELEKQSLLYAGEKSGGTAMAKIFMAVWGANQVLGVMLYIWLNVYDNKQHKLTGKDGISDIKLTTSGIMMIKPAGGLFIYLVVNSILCACKCGVCCCCGMIFANTFGAAY